MTNVCMNLASLLMTLCLCVAAASLSEAVTLVKDGQSEYSIVIPKNASQPVQYAAKELQIFLGQISGVTIPISSEKRLHNGRCIMIGPCNGVKKAGLEKDASQLAEDGVLLRSIGEDIALLGQNERGNLYSVYVFLEKYLGVRFLAWDCTYVPKLSEVKVPYIDYSHSSPFMSRETLYKDSFPQEIATRQRLNGSSSEWDERSGGKVEIYPYVHSLNKLFPEKEYFKDHPEYYGLQGGKRVAGEIHAQMCLTNPEVLKLATEKVLKWIEEHPEVSIFDVSQNDGNGACECDNCMAIVKEEGAQHGTILRFVNAIADEVAKKHPDKWIETLAYAYSVVPPTVTKPRPNVIIRVCHAGCFFHGFEKCKIGADLSTWLEQWSRMTKRIFVWHYATNFAHYFAPNPNLEGLVKDIRFYATHNVNGLMVQCNYQSPGGELAELRQYLCAQLMWDPNQDPMLIREDFCRHYYGNVSDVVLDFLAQMDELGREPKHVFAVWQPKDIVPPEFLKESLITLQKAYAQAEDEVIKNRIEKLLLPFWYTQLICPEEYGLSKEDAVVLLQRVRRLFEVNKITRVFEGDAVAETWLVGMEARYPSTLPAGVLMDLLRSQPVTIENCADWRFNTLERAGQTVHTFFQHPKPKGDADATFEVSLPKDEKATLKFGTVVSAPTKNGVRFAVLMDGKEVWSETKTTGLRLPAPEGKEAHDAIMPSGDPFSDHAVDLSAYAGQTIRLTLRVNALDDTEHDWANWIAPQIVAGK